MTVTAYSNCVEPVSTLRLLDCAVHLFGRHRYRLILCVCARMVQFVDRHGLSSQVSRFFRHHLVSRVCTRMMLSATEQSDCVPSHTFVVWQAELKALANTDLFKRLDKQTKDPERAAQRKKDVSLCIICEASTIRSQPHRVHGASKYFCNFGALQRDFLSCSAL